MKKKEYEMSVIVLTYYPDYEKLFQTLHSIVGQRDVSFEIIVSDDGSSEFDSEKVKQWFEQQHFEDYTIVANTENKGTVRNALAGVKAAKGDKVKLISPGDYLYDEWVLKRICEFMTERQSITCFGKAAYYSEAENGSLQFHHNCNPRYIRPYRKENLKAIQNNYLIYKDYILGAVFASDREALLKYLYKIVDKVVYAEDCAVICMVADGIKIDYWDDYMIWYEYGTGISTSQSAKWNQRLLQDNEVCFSMIQKEHPEWKKAYQITFDDKYNKRFLKKVRFFLHNKMTIVYRKMHKEKHGCDIRKLEAILSYDGTCKED